MLASTLYTVLAYLATASLVAGAPAQQRSQQESSSIPSFVLKYGTYTR